MIKLEKSESALNVVRTLIEMNTETAFNTKYFTQISQDTLIDILQMKHLNIDEVDLLIACSKWVDAEVDHKLLEPTIENKQKVFAPLKCLINFTGLNLDKIRKDNLKLDNLLSYDEIGYLFLHLMDKTFPLSIDNQVKRKKLQLYSAIRFELSSMYYYTNISLISLTKN